MFHKHMCRFYLLYMVLMCSGREVVPQGHGHGVGEVPRQPAPLAAEADGGVRPHLPPQ